MTTIIYDKFDKTQPIPSNLPAYIWYRNPISTLTVIASSSLAWIKTQSDEYDAYIVPQEIRDIGQHYTYKLNEQQQLVLTLKPKQNQEIIDLHNDQLYTTRDNWRMFCHLFRNEAETDQHRLESLRNCYQLDIIHWIYENYTQLQSRLAFENISRVRGMVRRVSELMVSQFITFDETSGIHALHPNYTTIAKAEMTRGKLKGRLEHDKTLTEPKLVWNITPEQFMTHFMTPPPATLTVYISSINNRGGTPINAEVTAINTRPNVGSVRWEQKFGSIWSPLPDSGGTSYTPPTTQDLTIRAVATGYLDLDGEVIPDVASNELSIQR